MSVSSIYDEDGVNIKHIEGEKKNTSGAILFILFFMPTNTEHLLVPLWSLQGGSIQLSDTPSHPPLVDSKTH